jgi:hypothetical protein
VSLESVAIDLFLDPTYGIPLLIAIGGTAGVSWWSQRRSAELPPLLPGSAPEFWRIRIDSRAYFTLQQGRYLVAVDGLGRRLGELARDKFHIRIGRKIELERSSADPVLPRPLTLRGIVDDLSRAYFSAFTAEEPGWLALRWPWLRRRQQRRAARDFAIVTAELAIALPALEAA